MKNQAALKKASEFKFTPKENNPEETAAVGAARSFITANLSVELEYYNAWGQVGFHAVAGRGIAVRIENNGTIDKQYFTPKYFIDLTKDILPQVADIKARLAAWNEVDRHCDARDKTLQVAPKK